MKYYSTILNRVFDTPEQLQDAEKVYEEKKIEAEKVKAKRTEDAKKVEEAYKLAEATKEAADDALREFVKKYGSYHTSITKPEKTTSVLEILNNFPFWF